MATDYDRWKLASPDDGWQPECVACDDAGCPECCPIVPQTLDDLEERDDVELPPRERIRAPHQNDPINYIDTSPRAHSTSLHDLVVVVLSIAVAGSIAMLVTKWTMGG